jgi:hypothetical protein
MTNRLRRWAALAPVLLALLGTGCVNEPRMTVHHAEVQGASMAGLGILVVLQVRNDNSYDVQLRSLRATVTFGGRYPLYPVDISPNQWLPAGRTTMVAVPVVIPWTLVPALAAETVGSPVILYHVKGQADVTATRAFGIERDNYPVDQSGSIPRHIMVGAARSVVPIPF